jgi:antitoxin CcdA
MPSITSHADAPATAKKRAVNLTLSDSVVTQARNYTASLSATVEALLTDFVTAQQQAKATRLQQANGWCADWNGVHQAVGSFSDEHSTL